jgi:hypothetical protein
MHAASRSTIAAVAPFAVESHLLGRLSGLVLVILVLSLQLGVQAT